jgi:hypothetical protein
LLILVFIAVTPDEAAKSLAEFIEDKVDISQTGTFWAVRGAGYIYSFLVSNNLSGDILTLA